MTGAANIPELISHPGQGYCRPMICCLRRAIRCRSTARLHPGSRVLCTRAPEVLRTRRCRGRRSEEEPRREGIDHSPDRAGGCTKARRPVRDRARHQWQEPGRASRCPSGVGAQFAKISRNHDVAKAIIYILRRWNALTRFLNDGRVCLSNNAAERSLRCVPLGRKSWLFSGSDRSGQRAAIASCIGIGAPICTKSQPVRTASRPSAYAYCSSTEK